MRAEFNEQPYIAQHGGRSNPAGYRVHNWYGSGKMDVDAAVAQAMSRMPDSLAEFVEPAWYGEAEEPSLAVRTADGRGVSASLEVTGLPEARVSKP